MYIIDGIHYEISKLPFYIDNNGKRKKCIEVTFEHTFIYLKPICQHQWVDVTCADDKENQLKRRYCLLCHIDETYNL